MNFWDVLGRCEALSNHSHSIISYGWEAAWILGSTAKRLPFTVRSTVIEKSAFRSPKRNTTLAPLAQRTGSPSRRPRILACSWGIAVGMWSVHTPGLDVDQLCLNEPRKKTLLQRQEEMCRPSFRRPMSVP